MKKFLIISLISLFIQNCYAVTIFSSSGLYGMKDENNNVINGFELENAWPISDIEGANLPGYHFIVKNNCNLPVVYQILVDSINISTGEKELSPNFVKVQLDDKVSRRYSDLNDYSYDESLNLKASKIIYTGMLQPNNKEGSNASHTIRTWISSDSPDDDIGGNFQSKVRVEAGQNISDLVYTMSNIGPIFESPDLENPNEENGYIKFSPLAILNENGNPITTVNDISIGDKIEYGTQEFYVIDIEGNDVKLLSRYLLNVGPNINTEYMEGIQCEEAGITRNQVDDPYSVVSYGFLYDTTPEELDESKKVYEDYYFGALPFADRAYWVIEEGFNRLENDFIYDDNYSYLSNYINNYIMFLNKFGLNAKNGSLLSLEDYNRLCNNSCPDYLYETTYWLGSMFGLSNMYYIRANGNLNKTIYNNTMNIGLRPVITITLSS